MRVVSIKTDNSLIRESRPGRFKRNVFVGDEIQKGDRSNFQFSRNDFRGFSLLNFTPLPRLHPTHAIIDFMFYSLRFDIVEKDATTTQHHLCVCVYARAHVYRLGIDGQRYLRNIINIEKERKSILVVMRNSYRKKKRRT